MKIQKIIFAPALLVMGISLAFAAPPPTKFSNQGSIANTRHNLTQSTMSGQGAGFMDASRNNYGEVCVYCHTPHGANTTVAAPLWNRTMKATNYTTYNQLGTSSLTQTVTQPGAESLTCLSCHDGQTAIDSIVNMPGSGRYEASQATAQNTAFLDTWPGGPAIYPNGGHGTLSNSPAALAEYGMCQSCHSMNGDQFDPNNIPAFDVFNISTDLRNDHPVGITFPTGNAAADFKTPGGLKGSVKYFDDNGNGKMDSADVRLYSDGGPAKVECASCHDPHGVPSAGPGSTFKPTFLRVSNTSSTLCLTCHSK